MGLSNDLISQFVKVTNDKVDTPKSTTVYGTVVKENDIVHVQIDGSEGRLTPISPTTTDVENGDRVSVSIVNHSAVITGNLTSPSARTHTVQTIDRQVQSNTENITLLDTVIAGKVSAELLEAEKARIDELIAVDVEIRGTLTANTAKISTLETEKLSATEADIKYATIDNLTATNANITNLSAEFGTFKELSTGKFGAVEADIGTLRSEKLDANFANIDAANIDEATFRAFYAQSGMIQYVTSSDMSVTGHLKGVVISGDLIEANTLKADKLVVKGKDGLYYKLNVDANTVESEQTNENSLNGSIILAKSITASKVSVTDLVAFGATIGGYHITNNSIYSGTKSSVGNTTRGVYFDTDGQIAFGDASNFLKFYKGTDNKYRLAISADSLIFSSSGTDVGTAITSAQNTASNAATAAGNAATAASNAQSTANAAKSTADSAATTASNASTAASNAQSTANTAKSTADTAKTTADSAKTTASNAATTASNAATAASNAQSTANTAKSTAESAASTASSAQSTANTANNTANSVKTDLANNYTKKTLPDTRTDNQNPGWYITNYPKQIITEFKSSSVIGLSGETYCTLTTTVPWGDPSGGYPKQVAKVNAKEYWRVGTSNEAWGAWNDAIGKAEAAAKTATNYMKFESGKGLTIGDMTANTLGRNVLIDSDSVDIRNGTKVLASYSDNAIQLGMNSPLSVIDLCDGTGTITSSALSGTDDWWKLEIRSQNSIGIYTGKGEVTIGNYVDNANGDWATTSICATASTPWTSNPEYGIIPERNGVMLLSTEIKDTEAWGRNYQYVELSGPRGVVIGQESTPRNGDTQSARIIVKASSDAFDYGDIPPPSITLEASDTNVTGRLILATNNERIFGKTTTGDLVEAFQAMNSGNNTVVGWGNYSRKSGNTNIYGNDVQIGVAAAGASGILYKPYYCKGESISNIAVKGSGYVTNASADVHFCVPLAKPIIGTPTVSASTPSGGGFILRQNSHYTHGSSATARVVPSKYTVTRDPRGNYVTIVATFSAITNAVNNAPIGIDWNGNITFS